MRSLACMSALGLLVAACSPQSPSRPKPKVAQLKLVSFVPGQYGPNEASVPASIPRYDLPNNRLVFTQKNVRVLVVTGVEPYEQDGFEINGLVDPDIQVVRGARIAFDVINVGPIGPRDFLIETEPPPYPPLIQEPWPWSRRRPAFGKSPDKPGREVSGPILPGRSFLHAIADVVATYDAVTTGTAWYVGPLVKSGRDGLYGRIIVVP